MTLYNVRFDRRQFIFLCVCVCECVHKNHLKQQHLLSCLSYRYNISVLCKCWQVFLPLQLIQKRHTLSSLMFYSQFYQTYN